MPRASLQLTELQSRGSSHVERWAMSIVLAPVVGAFGYLLWTHRVPSLLFPVAVVFAAFVVRVLKPRRVEVVREAVLAEDGLFLQRRFIPLAELARVEQEGDVVRVATTAGEQLELHGDPDELERASAVVHALELARGASTTLDAEGVRLLAEVGPEVLRLERGGAYRGVTLEPARCLAIAEDPAAAPHVRAIAARLVVRDETKRARVASLAEETANPELRATFLEVAKPSRADERRGG